jgi:hypothetical protein
MARVADEPLNRSLRTRGFWDRSSAALRTAPTTLDLEIARMEKLARQRLSELTTTIETSPLDARMLGPPPAHAPVIHAPWSTAFQSMQIWDCC